MAAWVSIGAIAAATGAVWWFEHAHVYRPSANHKARPEELGVAAEDVAFVAEDSVRLHGWWIPAASARGTVLYCHGNAGNVADRLAAAAALRELAVNVFLFDYRGYGRSRGFPSEHGLRRDARAAYEIVRAKYADADEFPVVLYGGSLGGAVAAQLATERPVRGVIMENTFTSIVDMAAFEKPWYPARWLACNRYDTLAKAPRIAAPLLLAHSPADERMPFDMARRIHAGWGGPKRLVTISGPHGEGGWETQLDYRREVAGFLDHVLGPAHPEANA